MEKSKRFGLVLSPVEKAAITHLAEAEGGLSLAATIRRLIRQEAHERGLWPTSSTNTQPSTAREVPRAD